jgi:hypothetical protein
MTASLEPSVLVQGWMSVGARPRLHVGRKPVPDPAHSTFHANAAAAGRAYRLLHPGEQYTGAGVSLALPVGSPLLFSAKTLVDGLVTAGLFSGDRCDSLSSLWISRHDPYSSPLSGVRPSGPSGIGEQFSVAGIPAPPAYTPVNASPRFHGTPRTPLAYRKALTAGIHIENQDWSAECLRAPSEKSALLVVVGGGMLLDLDNAALRVLDALETLRPVDCSDTLLDEIVGAVRVSYSPTEVAPGIMHFQFLDVQDESFSSCRTR